MNKTNNIVVKFREIQRFRQKWLWIAIVVVLLGLIISFGYGMIEQLVFGHSWGNRPMSDTALAILGPLMILLGIGISWLFLRLKLHVEVREDGVHINFVPLARQTVPFRDIVSCEVRT